MAMECSKQFGKKSSRRCRERQEIKMQSTQSIENTFSVRIKLS
jgi:hypothetical protein